MIENKFFLLLINFLWMAGLFGALFALVYLVQYRRKHWWHLGYTYQVPRTLALLYGGLLLFVLGLALHAYTAGQPVALGVAVVWALLALLFLFQWIEAVIDGLQEGWDTPLVEETDEAPWGGLSLGGLLAMGLLVINIGLLSWWGTEQVRAGVLDFTTLPTMLRGSSTAPQGAPLVQRQPLALSAQATDAPMAAGWFAGWLELEHDWVGIVATRIAAFGQATPAIPTQALTPFAPAQARATAPASGQADIGRAGAVGTAVGTRATVSATTAPVARRITTQAIPQAVMAATTPTEAPTETPTEAPTATASPVPTAAIPPTPRPTATATPTATPRPLPTPTPFSGVVTLVNPLDQESSNGHVSFEWEANFTPSAGYAFELIFWEPNQDPMRRGFGVAAPTLGHQAQVDLRRLDNDLGDRLEPATYQWGVLLVRTTPTYERIRFLGGGRQFTFYR